MDPHGKFRELYDLPIPYFQWSCPFCSLLATCKYKLPRRRGSSCHCGTLCLWPGLETFQRQRSRTSDDKAMRFEGSELRIEHLTPIEPQKDHHACETVGHEFVGRGTADMESRRLQGSRFRR